MTAQEDKFLVLALLCCVVGADVEVNPLKFKDIMYKSWSPPRQGLIQDSYNVSTECEVEVNRLIHGDPKTLEGDVAMALDAFGKPPAGILQLNLGWFGHYDECMAIDGFNYCLAVLTLNTTKLSKYMINKQIASSVGAVNILGLKYGLCTPTNCSENDVRAVLTHLLDALKIFERAHIPLDAVEDQSVTCTKDPTIPYSAGVICTIVLCGIIASLMVFGALYDEFLKFQAKKPPSPSPGPRIGHLWRLLEDTDSADDDVPILKDVGTGPSINREQDKSKEQNLATKLLLCFALNRNLAKLMDTKQGDQTIGSLNGIRVISMSWVMLGHTLVFGLMTPTDNLPTVVSWLSTHAGFQAIANAYYSVDSFFFLSGFLVAYLTFARFRELRSAKHWALFYFHRYWRLTPLLAFTILVWMYIPQFFGSGPLWQSSAVRPLCPQYWWSDLLYINNFWPKAFINECVAWTWYLANDMQFFIISPLLMAPLFYFPKCGWLALVGTLMASLITTGLIIGTNDLSVSLLNQTQQSLPGADFNSMVYGKPYCRIAPYLVGIGLGYIMHRIGKSKIMMSPVLVLMGWLAAAGLALSVVYGLYPTTHAPPLPKAANIVYGSVSRFVWALAVAWVVFACKYGYGGWINRFLSWSVWVPLARVTFSAYLFHPIVMTVFYYNFASPAHFSVYLLAFYFAGLVSVSYAVAILVAMAIEYPTANLEKVLLPSLPKAKTLAGHNSPDAASTDVVTVVTGAPVGDIIVCKDAAFENGAVDSNEKMS